ncbi:hypothetical protein GCM10022205_29510 [Spinactinospora alkalitolerans]
MGGGERGDEEDDDEDEDGDDLYGHEAPWTRAVRRTFGYEIEPVVERRAGRVVDTITIATLFRNTE